MHKVLAISLLFLPVLTHAQVLLSEIAWMGTDENSSNEWIELYNFSTTPTDLTGWTLSSGDGAILINLIGTLSPHGVGVLERSDDTTLPQVTALLTYTGALANGGTTLTLKDANGVVSDEVVGGSNWESIGGTNVIPKKTPQRTRTGSWVTSTPTPGSENAETGDQPTTTLDTHTTSENNTVTKKTSSGGGSSAKSSVGQKKEGVTPNPTLSLSFTVPKVVYVNEKVRFVAEPSGIGETIMNSLVYTWNFGDTYTETGKAVSHTFTRPGEYIVVLRGTYAKHDVLERHEVLVLPTAFIISRTPNGDLRIENKSTEEVHVGGFSVGLGSEFVFPQYTFIKANGSLVVPKERLGKSALSPYALLDTKKTVVAHENQPESDTIQQTSVARRTPSSQTFMSKTLLTDEDVTAVPLPQSVETTTGLHIPKETETVIQIGKGSGEVEESGFLSWVFKKVSSFLNF